MDTPVWSARELTSHEQSEAKALFERNVELIGPGSFDDVQGEKKRVRNWMARTGEPAPDDTWLGIVHDGAVIGAVHAQPNYGQAAEVLSSLGHPDGGTPEWLHEYVKQVASIDEVAVEPTYRRQGAAAALLRAGQRALVVRGARAASGFATTPENIEPFRSLKFTIGGFRQPVPPKYANGLNTAWWSAAPDHGRYFWKTLPQPGSAFGMPTRGGG